MITGVVNAAYEAIVTLQLRGPAGQTREIAGGGRVAIQSTE